MRKVKMLALAIGLSLMALHASRGAAASACEEQCNVNYQRCQQVCSVNDCIISCDTQLQACLSSCN